MSCPFHFSRGLEGTALSLRKQPPPMSPNDYSSWAMAPKAPTQDGKVNPHKAQVTFAKDLQEVKNLGSHRERMR